MVLRDVAFRDGDEAREAGFRCEQIVEGRVEPSRTLGVRETVADREDAPSPVVEQTEPHSVAQRRRTEGQRTKPRFGGFALKVQRRDALQHGSTPERNVTVGVDSLRPDDSLRERRRAVPRTARSSRAGSRATLDVPRRRSPVPER